MRRLRRCRLVRSLRIPQCEVRSAQCEVRSAAREQSHAYARPCWVPHSSMPVVNLSAPEDLERECL